METRTHKELQAGILDVFECYARVGGDEKVGAQAFLDRVFRSLERR